MRLSESVDAPESTGIPAMVSHLVGHDVAAFALVCARGLKQNASVIAFFTPEEGARSALFRHAVAMEESYSDALLGFSAVSPPDYGPGNALVDLKQAAIALRVERVLCLITLDQTGAVRGIQNYDGLEVTLLEAVNVQLSRFSQILARDHVVESRRMQ